ncbi:MAG: hypothetical protein ACLRFK_03150 [Alphaproteobacteria bacterium]
MKFSFRTIFLKSLPYIMSIAGGVILYTGAIDNAPNDNIRDLVINVSASLLSIPLVFLLYDYTNNRINSRMKRHMANSVGDKLNDLMINLILLLREMLSVRSRPTTENINRMLSWRASDISKRLNIKADTISKMHTYHNDLDTLLYRNSQTDVLTSEQIQILSSLARAMTHFINENKFHKNRHVSAKYLETVTTKILDWLDLDNVAALDISKHLTGEQNDKKQKNEKK